MASETAVTDRFDMVGWVLNSCATSDTRNAMRVNTACAVGVQRWRDKIFAGIAESLPQSCAGGFSAYRACSIRAPPPTRATRMARQRFAQGSRQRRGPVPPGTVDHADAADDSSRQRRRPSTRPETTAVAMRWRRLPRLRRATMTSSVVRHPRTRGLGSCRAARWRPASRLI